MTTLLIDPTRSDSIDVLFRNQFQLSHPRCVYSQIWFLSLICSRSHFRIDQFSRSSLTVLYPCDADEGCMRRPHSHCHWPKLPSFIVSSYVSNIMSSEFRRRNQNHKQNELQSRVGTIS